jgi:phenylacetate-CoA ligase
LDLAVAVANRRNGLSGSITVVSVRRRKDVAPHYQLVVDREDNLDVLTVKIEVGEGCFSDEVKGLQDLERRITKNIKELLGVSARVKLVEPKTIERSQGKAVRVVDNRSI